MAELQMFNGPGAPKRFPLSHSGAEAGSEDLLLGRDERSCGIHLTHPCVSRRHARIVSTARGHVLIDQESKAGTYLNGQRMNPFEHYTLYHNDMVQVCCYAFVFLDEKAKRTWTESAGPVVLEQDTSSDTDFTSVLDISPEAWTRRSDVKPKDKLLALMQLTRNLRNLVELDSLLERVLDSLLTMFTRAERAMLVLGDAARGTTWRTVVRCRVPGREIGATLRSSVLNQVLDRLTAVISDDERTMSVPLLGRLEEPLGVIQLESFDRQRRFSADDLDLLTTVALQVSFAVENAMLHEVALRQRALDQELRVAHQIQVELLPSEPPQIEGYDFFDYYAAAKQVGGDYYDYLPLEDGRLALVLGDVSGKGVPAAMLMVKVSSELGVYLAREASPVAVLNAVNQRFLRRNTEGNFVTMVLAVLDLNEHAIELVIAGHIRPLLCRTDGSVVDVGDVEAGLPLGVESQHRYASTGLGVEVGQTLVLVSDGITEAENAQGEFFGLKRLRELVADTPASADEVGHRIIEAVDRFVGDHPQTDDRCVLCIHRHR